MILYRELPILQPLPDKNRYVLIENLNIVYKTDGQIRALLVPKGYITDGATIPTILHSVVGTPYSPKFITAAVCHDWHCDLMNDKIPTPNSYVPTVEEASDLFFELLKLDGVSLPKAFAMSTAVRLYKSVF